MNCSRSHKHSIRLGGLSSIRPPLVAALASLAVSTVTPGQEALILPIPTKDVAVVKNNQNIAIFRGGTLRGDPGHPALPAVVFKVLLPPSAVTRSVRAKIVNPKLVTLPGRWRVEPMPPPITSDAKILWPEKAIIEGGKDIAAYNADSPQPGDLLTNCSAAWLREWCLAEIVVTLFQYNPSTEALTQLESGSVEILFDRRETKPISRTRAHSSRVRIRDLVEDSVVNFADMKGEYDEIKE